MLAYMMDPRLYITEPIVAKDLGKQKVVLEGNLQVVQTRKKDGMNWCSYRIVLNSLQEWHVNHVKKRNVNAAAH